jgi:hypothetical protein
MSNPDDDEEGRDRANYLVLGIAVAIVAIGIFLMWLLQHYQQQENCRIEGRRNCDPIQIPNS